MNHSVSRYAVSCFINILSVQILLLLSVSYVYYSQIAVKYHVIQNHCKSS